MKIHLVDYIVGGLPHTKCGVYVDNYNITAFPKEVTCLRCLRMLGDFVLTELLQEVMES